ncbi:hypothetical protein N0V83_002803 [Neocucurbitaria cava]|uniref:Uncharacterized protein n=1 Tax=Neocucurbitaria cava TaxID=798079 RepID=A0A9W8YCT4_9PLEO|nr:hypothetical protein N0V83_002803 [Neocucurbitaria cava]
MIVSRSSTAMTSTPEKSITRASTATDSPNDEKRKRRFSLSSPFYRSNRSRSRPSSIALPSNTPSIFGNTPRNTPPRELAGGFSENSRPHSYHALDSWNFAPGVQPSFDQTQTTPPRSTPQSQSRLGILPSPAKSAFSSQEKDIEQDIPPVPPLPDAIQGGQGRGVSQDDASHRMLQSVIRYATPPIPTTEAEKPVQSPGFTEAGARGPRVLDTGKALPPAPAEIDDDDDLPPQLNHDPLPLATKPPPGEISSAIFFAGPSQVDVSDEDDDGKRSQVDASSRVRAPSSQPVAGDVSPLMPPVQSSLDEISDEDDGLQRRTGGTGGSEDDSHRQERDQDAGRFVKTALNVLDKYHSPKTETLESHHAALTSERKADEPRLATEDRRRATDASPVNMINQNHVTGTGLTAKRPSFETELIGDDISPVSMHSRAREIADDYAPPKVTKPVSGSAKSDLYVPKARAKDTLDSQEGSPRIGPRLHLPEQDDAVSKLSDQNHSSGQTGEIGLAVPGATGAATRDGSLSPGHASPPHLHANAGADPVDHPTRRVSATPFQVVHAVEEYAASNSSLASWDRDSIAARSHSVVSHPDEMRDESDLVTPVAQVPRITQNGPQADKARAPYDDTSNMATQNGYFRGHVASAGSMHQNQQLQPPTSDMTVPERSKSLLSQISAMVSEGGNPISPASSIAGRSTPSTIRRMQHDSSTSTKAPWTTAQIPEESTAAWNDQTPTAKDDGFDLYADHNGIVKDVRDESGQPLRVADAQVPGAPQQASLPNPTGPATVAAVDSKNEDRPRYSTERPMSFISGPPDQDGKPQDQINQFALQNDTHVTPAPEQFRQQLQQSDTPPIGTAYSVAPPAAVIQHQLPAQSQQRYPSEQQALQGFVFSNNDLQNGSANVQSNERTRAPVTSPSLPPPQDATQPLTSTERPTVDGQVPPNNQLPTRGPLDPRMYETAPGQPMLQGSPAHGQMLMPDHDPRAQGQPLGPPSGPRNQYEYQQQMMQLQARYARSQGAQNHTPPVATQQSSSQPPKQHAKPSSKPRLSSVFKNFGGKSHNIQQSSTMPTNSNLKPLPADPNRNASFHSAVSSLSLSHETTSMGRPGEQPGSFVLSNRPPSMGAESRFSQVSQGSTRVQPTDSRVDLRKPASPAPFYGIPPQQLTNVPPIPNGQPHQQHAQQQPQPQPQPQSYHTATPGNQEAGKKKRFSTLGGLFNRTGLAGDALPTKLKISKDEKKALKAQRNSTAPLAQAPVSQWPPQQQQFRPQQPGMAYPPGQVPPQMSSGMRPMGQQFVPPQTMSSVPQGMQGSQGVQDISSQRLPQQHQQFQAQSPGSVRPNEGSAYFRTKQLADEHQAQRIPAQSSGQGSRPNAEATSTSFDHSPPNLRQTSMGPPAGGYYKPDTKQTTADQGAYAASQAAQQQALERAHQERLREKAAYAASPLEHSQLQQRRQPMQGQGVSAVSQAERLQAQQRQRPMSDQSAYASSQAARAQGPQQRPQPPHEQSAYGDSQAKRQNAPPQREQQMSEQMAYQNLLAQRQLAERQRQQPVSGSGGHWPSQDDRVLPQQQQQQQQRPEQQFHPQYRQSYGQPPSTNQRSFSGPVPGHLPHAQSPASQRHVSSPLGEPQYEAPPIPAAYNHVSGAFVSPRDRQQQPLFPPYNPPLARPSMDQYGRQNSDSGMPSISPQVSAQSIPPNSRTHSDASTVSVISPISNTPDLPTAQPYANQRPQKPRMSSISEVHLQEQPWHLNFPQGATEQEIVRARQRQYMEQQFTAQQQLHAERAAQSPSTRSSPHEQSQTPEGQRPGGFKELLPRNSPQPYPMSQPVQSSQQEPPRASDSPQPLQPAPIHPDQPPQPAAYPLPMSPDNVQSPVNPLAGALPPPQLPPKLPHSPMRPMFPPTIQPPSEVQQHQQQQVGREPQRYETSQPPQSNDPQDEQPMPDEPPPSYNGPPSYDGPGVSNDGMDKSRPEQPRPPNITTDALPGERGRQQEPRQRQPSLGMLQHPQPASMAASPQRSSADMGAESLRRQLLQQEEHLRMERIQRAQIQRAETERERQEREAARARARELERSASGGGRVGSLRSVAGSRNGGTPGWERRGSSSRPVFELPAVEDDEPAMKATSYPGQEWVPPMWTDD